WERRPSEAATDTLCVLQKDPIRRTVSCWRSSAKGVRWADRELRKIVCRLSREKTAVFAPKISCGRIWSTGAGMKLAIAPSMSCYPNEQLTPFSACRSFYRHLGWREKLLFRNGAATSNCFRCSD